MSLKAAPFGRGIQAGEMTSTAWAVESCTWLQFCLRSLMQQFIYFGFRWGYQKNISVSRSYVDIFQHCYDLCFKTYTQKNKSCLLRCPVNTKCLHNMRRTLYLSPWSKESEWRWLLVVLWHSKALNSSHCWQKNIIELFHAVNTRVWRTYAPMLWWTPVGECMTSTVNYLLEAWNGAGRSF